MGEYNKTYNIPVGGNSTKNYNPQTKLNQLNIKYLLYETVHNIHIEKAYQ